MLQDLCEHTGSGAPAVFLVCGPKNVGKSAFSRLLCNRLLHHKPPGGLGFLEGDCGQPEVGPPGFVSLTCLRQPLLMPVTMSTLRTDRAVFVGDTTAESNPVFFVRAIAQLAHAHRSQASPGEQQTERAFR